MGHPDFRVGGKIFATLQPGNKVGVVKLMPEQQEEFVRRSPGVFVPANGAWGLQGYTTVQLAAVEEEILGEALTLAWQNTARTRPAASRPTRKRGGKI